MAITVSNSYLRYVFAIGPASVNIIPGERKTAKQLGVVHRLALQHVLIVLQVRSPTIHMGNGR